MKKRELSQYKGSVAFLLNDTDELPPYTPFWMNEWCPSSSPAACCPTKKRKREKEKEREDEAGEESFEGEEEEELEAIRTLSRAKRTKTSSGNTEERKEQNSEKDRAKRLRNSTATATTKDKKTKLRKEATYGKRYPKEVQQLLKDAYAKDARPSTETQHYLADVSGLSPYQIKIWFQNKRSRSAKGQRPRKPRKPKPRSSIVTFHVVDTDTLDSYYQQH